jgi:glycogen operon protein
LSEQDNRVNLQASSKLPDKHDHGWAAAEGSPKPLGVAWIEAEDAYNFAIFSEHATSVQLLFYGDDTSTPVFTYSFDYLANKSGHVWHCRLSRHLLQGAQYYGYRMDGPRSEHRFLPHAFDCEKILLDPYARSIYFPPDFSRLAAITTGSNAGQAMLGVLRAHETPVARTDTRCTRHDADLIIYELHVRGFTASPTSGVLADRRGTFAGLVEKIPYLVELGITAVELMPVFQFGPQAGDYWGYMPLSFFSPHHAYSSRREAADQHTEFRKMVEALHAAGIEVILDVVYNHTAEGNHAGPTYSFKGIDNDVYYLLSNDPRNPYLNFSGAGNTLACADETVRRLIQDSLRYWALEMQIDGFRFDLASVFSRKLDGSYDFGIPPIFSEIAAAPELAHVRLIAEPWDASGIYQLGDRFPGTNWLQWNARFRDDVRQFIKGDAGRVPDLMRRLYGSDDLFPDTLEEARRPYQSVNYVNSHDGFTLYDLVAYNEKRNWANDHGNTDGPEQNYSWNCGWEGDLNVPEDVLALRTRQAKNLFCLLMLANGIPMFRAGDEFLQTQLGNNNPYNQDNESTWLDWTRKERFADFQRFCRLMIAFRKAHPSLCRSRYWREDVRWHGVGAQPDLGTESRSLAFFLSGASEGDVDLYVMINAWWEDLTFTLQLPSTTGWRRAIDTGRPSPDDILDSGTEVALASTQYKVQARSVVVLVSR